MSKNDGGPAYPIPLAANAAGDFLDTEEYCKENGGMTLRDYFAGQALIGLSSACDAQGTWAGTGNNTAAEAYKLADAMLKEREE